MTRDEKQLLCELNKGMAEIKRVYGRDLPVAMKKYTRALDMFYEENDIQNMHGRFKTTDLLPFQEKEIMEIAVAMANDKEVLFLADYEEIERKGSFKEFHPENMKEIIRMMDNVQTFRMDSAINSLVTYEQYIDLMRKAKNKKFKPNLGNAMWLEYSMSGASGDILYERITEEINNYGKRKVITGQVRGDTPKTKKRHF